MLRLAVIGAMKKSHHLAGAPARKRIEEAEARATQAEARAKQSKTRAEMAETRTEQAETRTEMAKTRTEQAESRTEKAKTRAEQAEIRTEQAETALEHEVQKEVYLSQAISTGVLRKLPLKQIVAQKSPLEDLTGRQREILRLVAEGRNTKQIAETLKVSSKTVEYHRKKLMDRLNIHDVPGLVKCALRFGLIPPEV
jgi:DNA-binding CsgD family transcriptional regulator